VGIVDHDCKLISGQSIGPPDDEVPDSLLQTFGNFPLHEVGEPHRFRVHLKAYGATAFAGRQAVAAGAWIGTRCRQIRATAAAPVGKPTVE
jgi:hypothetical protein